MTVNANIDATWGPTAAASWTWQDLRHAFATALDAVMKAVAIQRSTRTTAIRNFPREMSLFAWIPSSSTGDDIPPAFQITAYNNGLQAGQVTITYSTGDQSGGSVCDAIGGIVGGGLPLFLENAPAAVVGTVMTVACDLIDG